MLYTSRMSTRALNLTERYIASFLLSAAGDALGYRNGRWEFCFQGSSIHSDLEQLGGLGCINLSLPKWRVSDDTVMHLATAEALIKVGQPLDIETYRREQAGRYCVSMEDMSGRAEGDTSSVASYFRESDPQSYTRPFNERGGGCGGAMRAMCIGLRFWRPEELETLVAVSIEAGRLTHNNPTGFLGSYVSALFTAYAVQGKPLHQWGADMMVTLEQAWQYIEKSGRDVPENKAAWNHFGSSWQEYLKLRKIEDGTHDAVFPDKFDVQERDDFYKSLSMSGWGGASGHDSTIISYDALLGCQGSWEEFCYRGILHGGDNDSTGAIGGAWFGAKYGLAKTLTCHYQFLEYKDRLANMAVEIFKLANPGEAVNTLTFELAPTLITNRSVVEDLSDGEGECHDKHSRHPSEDDD